MVILFGVCATILKRRKRKKISSIIQRLNFETPTQALSIHYPSSKSIKKNSSTHGISTFPHSTHTHTHIIIHPKHESKTLFSSLFLAPRLKFKCSSIFEHKALPINHYTHPLSLSYSSKISSQKFKHTHTHPLSLLFIKNFNTAAFPHLPLIVFPPLSRSHV